MAIESVVIVSKAAAKEASDSSETGSEAGAVMVFHGRKVWVPFEVRPSPRDLESYYGFTPCLNAWCCRKGRSEEGFCWQCWALVYTEAVAKFKDAQDFTTCEVVGCFKKVAAAGDICKLCRAGIAPSPDPVTCESCGMCYAARGLQRCRPCKRRCEHQGSDR